MKNERRTAAAALSRTPSLEGLSAPRAYRMPTGGDASTAPTPSSITADVPAGVHCDTFSQLAPVLGSAGLPAGQTISVAMNAPSPHLPFREWMLRGVVAGAGHAAAWPFRLLARTVETSVFAVIDVLKAVVKWAVILLLAPTLALMGYRMATQMTRSASIEQGAQQMMHNGRHALNGIGRGATDELPTEDAAGKTSAR